MSALFGKVSWLLAHPKIENIVYVTKTGYGVNSKVYQSTDYGHTWSNISFNIPNIPVNCVQIDTESDSNNVDIYIGTDVGVFYKKDSDINWQYYGTGMPNTRVSDLEIYYPTGKLRAGTYGRGIWQTDIARQITPVTTQNVQPEIDNVSLLENPVNKQIEVVFSNEKQNIYDCMLVDMSGHILFQQHFQTNTGTSKHQFNIEQVSSGMYYLKISNKQNKQILFKILKN